MSLVYAGVLSHAPGITGRAELVENVAKRDEFYAKLAGQRQEIEDSGAEALIVIAAEHFGNFFMNNMPAFCIGMGSSYEGPIEDPEWLKRCSHTKRKSVVSWEEAIARIRAAAKRGTKAPGSFR